jgi:hypothetical protein
MTMRQWRVVTEFGRTKPMGKRAAFRVGMRIMNRRKKRPVKSIRIEVVEDPTKGTS